MRTPPEVGLCWTNFYVFRKGSLPKARTRYRFTLAPNGWKWFWLFLHDSFLWGACHTGRENQCSDSCTASFVWVRAPPEAVAICTSVYYMCLLHTHSFAKTVSIGMSCCHLRYFRSRCSTRSHKIW